MDKRLIKYVYAFCVDNGFNDVFDYNRFVIDKKYARKEEDRLDLPKVSYNDNKEEFKELKRMLDEHHANQQMKVLIKQTGWFKSTMYLALLRVGSWLRKESQED